MENTLTAVEPCPCDKTRYDDYTEPCKPKSYGYFRVEASSLTEQQFVDKMLELLQIGRDLGFNIKNFSVESY